jgi:hypothetical protein
MHLWKIQNGIPSLADNFLVAGGTSVGIGGFVLTLDRALEFFEARGFNYLGYAVVFLAFGTLGGLGLWLFRRNEKRLRAEVIIPRRVFGFGIAAVLILVTTSLVAQVFRLPLMSTGSIVVGIYTFLYTFVVKAALRWPARTATFSLCLSLVVGAVGVLTQFLNLARP